MARFTQYPAASIGDYADATTFLIANSDGEIKQASLEALNENYFCKIACAEVTIPSSEVLTLFSSPKEIVPAQGAGTIIDPISVVCKMVNNTLPYATNIGLNIGINGSSTIYYTDKFLNTVAASPVYHKLETNQPSIVSSQNIDENDSLRAWVSTGNPTSGDGDVVVSVIYRVISM